MSAREAATSFGDDAAGYDAGRPAEPAALLDAVEVEAGPLAGARVLEIGAGTGRATRALLARGVRALHAVEPDARMAARLDGLPGVSVEIARFEEARARTGVDLVVAATAFHWIADPSAALGRIRAVLVPGGAVALWFTVHRDPNGADAFSRALAPVWAAAGLGAATAKARHGAGPPSPARGLGWLGATGFEGPRHRRLDWRVEHDAASLRALYASFSPVRLMAPAPRETLLDTIERLAREDFGDRLVRTYHTTLFTARAPGAPRR